MNAILCYVIVISVGVSAVVELKLKSKDSVNTNDKQQWIPGVVAGPSAAGATAMSSTVYMSVSHYSCAAEDTVEDQVALLYGTKSWTFPIQDVNLTLSYPSISKQSQQLADSERYLITAFSVVLYIDGLETRGYIMDGGVLQESLTLMFESNSIQSLSYEFWLYGLPKTASYGRNSTYFVCT